MDSTQEQKETRRLAGKWTALFLGLSALTVWAGVLLQFYVSTQVLGQGHVAGYVKYISFFTTLGNILAALSLSTLCIPLNIRVWKFFSRTTVRSAVAVYIIVVAVAYSVLLRHLWNPEGIQYVADVILHDISPVLYVIAWIFFVPKGTLHWKNTLVWLLFPLVYFIYILTRGAFFQVYPYPFLDAGRLGYQAVLINALALLTVFVVLGFMVVFVDRKIGLHKGKKSK
jgi:hypothetical protein